ncbi:MULTISPECIES: tRNA (guanosine(37)-N1)-methyltransferase TrmD [Legionella]|uniref:tRNA (guanine-N(1)-)-methyltransferase n=1 Tax=Legionella septentrionalis TaxID=2498109 RepID=A0A3S0VMX1_9GAMM|nr:MULTISPECIES: tRNA (guanosine(37)-N1)-methyltransferase TrmD [Legionella]MCP0913880.1 tRNA (guanosine(37)-N1)-methyltransferase TrmD [Legionella sp. 27cVA30]RUQ85253.1 tRNA (guanosine(37)-N1)-methyltransferase TrmD [Legionella septentrionalis]RUQ98722.1 tRNA (guanosine(37)-N1)-methyltransferase TrmD [Legionella septentrionalis]RUR09905.1 tRNA (guanosine(37)-N1)-methyltransferase TrmD [Legionella septentrionalis]RUR15015.1 tRNA (guanosine(37)-N1)-methyltransferase TrmD [Legionella septentrio
MFHFGIISLLPEMFASLQYGITGRAIKHGLVNIDVWNPRDWAKLPYRQVDDKPYGGGPGMVMMYEPLHAAIVHARQQMPAACRAIYLSPQGRRIVQKDLNEAAAQKRPLLFIAGRYEGIDERIMTECVEEEWSLGDFVLSGGEMAAMVFIDAITRLLPGSLGHHGSAQQDSFMHGLLDYPHYTRPPVVNHAKVPDVLLSGNHHEIARWRKKQALGRTWLKRPDLLDQLNLNDVDKQLLIEFQREHGYSV